MLLLKLFADTYATNEQPDRRKQEALCWFVRLKVFFMSCKELWGYSVEKSGEFLTTLFVPGYTPKADSTLL